MKYALIPANKLIKTVMFLKNTISTSIQCTEIITIYQIKNNKLVKING